jgi:hypothetical protein
MAGDYRRRPSSTPDRVILGAPMSDPTAPKTVDAALADSLAVVARLHATCCEPGRSPRIERLQETLAAARIALGRGDDVTAALADAGSQVGWLKIACCAEKRMPLYTEILTNLASAYRTLEFHAH